MGYHLGLIFQGHMVLEGAEESAEAQLSFGGANLPAELRNFLFRGRPSTELHWESLSDEEKASCFEATR